MHLVSQPERTKTLTDSIFRFSGIPRGVPDIGDSQGISVDDNGAIIILQARTVDSEDILEFQRLLNNGVSFLITLRSQKGQFFLWAHSDRPLYLGAVDPFPASVFAHRVINEMQHIPNAVQVKSVAVCKKNMPQTLRPQQWQRLMSLADDVEFMDERSYDEIMGRIWDSMGLTVYEVSMRIDIRYGETA